MSGHRLAEQSMAAVCLRPYSADLTTPVSTLASTPVQMVSRRKITPILIFFAISRQNQTGMSGITGRSNGANFEIQ
jgi:hypothetical protein